MANLLTYPSDQYVLTTAEFAAQYLVKPQSVRKRYSQTGSYHGIYPDKLKNGRLRWPDGTIRPLN